MQNAEGRSMMKKLLVVSIVCALAAAAQAELLIGFDFAGYAGNEGVGTSTVAAANMQSPAYVSRGAGLTAANNVNRFNATGWDGYSNSDDAFAGGNYFEFSVAPQLGYYMSITQVVFNLQRSNTGPGNVALRASYNSYASDISTLLGFASNSVTVTYTTDTSGIGGLQNVSGSITFRLVGWPGASGGSLGFEGPGNDIEVYGTTAVPEPTSAAMLGLGALLTVLVRKRLSA